METKNQSQMAKKQEAVSDDMMGGPTTRLIIVFILGVLIGYGGHWLFTRNGTAEEVTEDPTEEELLVETIEGKNGVIVRDQAPGSTVSVYKVVLENPGWVAIQDNNNGVPGRILGAELFDKGEHEGGVVDLLRKTEAGKKYFAVIRSDDGNYKFFNAPTDKVMNDESGKPIMYEFTVAATSTDSSIDEDSEDTATSTDVSVDDLTK